MILGFGLLLLYNVSGRFKNVRNFQVQCGNYTVTLDEIWQCTHISETMILGFGLLPLYDVSGKGLRTHGTFKLNFGIIHISGKDLTLYNTSGENLGLFGVVGKEWDCGKMFEQMDRREVRKMDEKDYIRKMNRKKLEEDSGNWLKRLGEWFRD
ncbi:hypothetical protein LOAG_09436 [Loa loa]|uniref:Uncharacterized protein n=1 Tax=Loa loa TaxID=7209 RepID=A0A1S0TS16_LOALO|nr:hypothetical protein LOAG_09436 [Loa loa]EFO19057.1 hypothetical protein LOAG_09436 [Loa loa]